MNNMPFTKATLCKKRLRTNASFQEQLSMNKESKAKQQKMLELPNLE
jgi:hypothetical protein